MSSFSVGDVVCCIDASGTPMLAYKGVYRVSSVDIAEPWYPDAGSVGLTLAGVTNADGYGGFKAKRFRKVQKADASFTLRMRACQPHKVSA